MKKIFTLFAALVCMVSMFAATETVYFVNASKWSGTINAYAWTSTSNANWPGVKATKEAEQLAGCDVYSYTAEAGKYANIIFNNGSSQTADLKWTAGKYYCKDGWYTKEDAAAKLGQPIEYETVYFVNVQGWSKVNIYTWTPEVGTWPGVAMTKEADKLAGKDVYSYTVEKGTSFGGMLFNNGSGTQTGDLKWTAGKYFVNNTWYTKEEAEAAIGIPVVDSWTMVGDAALFGTAWDLNAKANEMVKQADGSYALTLTNKTLDAKSYEYKAAKNHSWDVTVPGGDNAKLTVDKKGQYDITFTLNAAATSVTAKATYIPATYTVTATAENGTVTGAGEYKEGAEATLTATPAEGYEFVNWTVAGEVVSTENSYTFVVSADVVVVANFKKAVEEHTITLSGLLKYSNEFRGYTTLQNVEGDTAFFVYNYVDGVPAYGEGYSVTANLGDLTLEGTGSWKLIDELETITAVLYNEERTAVYNVTVSAKAPEVHNLTCTDALYVENISEWMSELTITGVIDEAALKISVYDWQEATAGTYYQVMGVLNDEVYIQPESAEVTIVDTKLTIAFSAVDEFGNTYNVNVTATPKPNTPLVVENATFTVDGDNLTIQGQWETKSVVVALVGWSTTKYGEYNAVLMTGTGEAEDDIYAEFSAVLSKDGTTATLTGVAVNWDGTKYDVTISGLAPAEAPTALDNVDTTVAPVKVIENGQLIIIRNGVQYNAQGAVVK